MLLQLTTPKEIMEVYRIFFVVLSGSAFIFLLYKAIKNKNKRGYAIPALIYFAILLTFYVTRLFNIPSDVYIANIISNTIHLLASILIFFTPIILIEKKK
jgi:hypothetical protein